MEQHFVEEPCQEGWHRPVLSLFAKVFTVFSCKLPKVTCFQKFAFAKRCANASLPHGRQSRLITPPTKRNRAFPMGNALLYISLSYVDFSGCVRVAHPVLSFQNCALIRAQRSSRFRVVAQQLFHTGPPLRQGDGYFVRCQVAQPRPAHHSGGRPAGRHFPGRGTRFSPR